MRFLAPWGISALFLLTSCAADPIAIPEAVPQLLQNNAPFSGAIYIVNPDGSQVAAQDANYCPPSASLSCGSVGQPSWCCPSSYTCAVPANSGGLIGCCPAGSSCGGAVAVAQVTTVTVYAAAPTQVVYVAPSTVVVYDQPTHVQAGFCATITMMGDNLPRTAQGACGTVLLVSDGMPSVKVLGVGMAVVMVVLHHVTGRMFR